LEKIRIGGDIKLQTREVPPRTDYGVVAFGELMSKVIRSLLENFTLTLLVQTHRLSSLGRVFESTRARSYDVIINQSMVNRVMSNSIRDVVITDHRSRWTRSAAPDGAVWGLFCTVLARNNRAEFSLDKKMHCHGGNR
jgi:hypothetical protein